MACRHKRPVSGEIRLDVGTRTRDAIVKDRLPFEPTVQNNNMYGKQGLNSELQLYTRFQVGDPW